MDDNEGFCKSGPPPSSPYYVYQKGTPAEKLPRTLVVMYGSPRGFRDFQRRSLRMALRWIETAAHGSAFTPGYNNFYIARTQLREAIKKNSREVWGR